MRPQALGGLFSRRPQGTRASTNQFRHRITRLERSRSSASAQGHLTSRDGARESAHLTRVRPQGSRGRIGRRPNRPEPLTTEAPRAGSSSGELAQACRGRRRIVVTTLRHVPHSSAPSGAETGRARDQRSRFARLRLGGPGRRSARHRPTGVPLRSQDGAASLELIHQQQFHGCESTRGYHAWTKAIGALAAGANAGCCFAPRRRAD